MNSTKSRSERNKKTATKHWHFRLNIRIYVMWMNERESENKKKNKKRCHQLNKKSKFDCIEWITKKRSNRKQNTNTLTERKMNDFNSNCTNIENYVLNCGTSYSFWAEHFFCICCRNCWLFQWMWFCVFV